VSARCTRCGIEGDESSLTTQVTCALPRERIDACREREIAMLRARLGHQAAPPPKLPDNTCGDCRLPRAPESNPFVDGEHCPRSRRNYASETCAERDCLSIGLAKAHANEARMRGLLVTVGEALDAAIAAQDGDHG
jgi:hypothetical protein